MANKNDQEKPMMDLIDPMFELGIARVLTHGAKEYGANNWKNVEGYRYIAAVKRHIAAAQKGEIFDHDTGESHYLHAACCLMFLYYKERHGHKDLLRPSDSSRPVHAGPELSPEASVRHDDDEGYYSIDDAVDRLANRVFNYCESYFRAGAYTDNDERSGCFTFFAGPANETPHWELHLSLAALSELSKLPVRDIKHEVRCAFDRRGSKFTNQEFRVIPVID